MSEQKTRVIVLFGGRSAEHDVSCVTARHVLSATDPNKYQVIPIGITRDGAWVRADDALAALKSGADALPDALKPVGSDFDLLPSVRQAVHEGQQVVVFPLMHGPLGEDGTMQGLLEIANVPYVGAGVLGSALAMDKIKAKETAAYHGIAQANWRGLHATEVHDTTADELIAELGLPLWIKPANMGSSIGVSRAYNADEVRAGLDLAASYDEWIVAEENVDGREIEMAVLGNLEPEVSLPGEIEPTEGFYSYSDKYIDGSAGLLIPAPLSDAEIAEAQALAVKAFKALRCEGMARADFFYDAGGRGWLLNELNTIPGFTPISMYPKMWEASGLEYSALIDRLVELAIERFERRPRRTDH